MTETNQVSRERWSLVSGNRIADVIAAIDAVTGQPDMREFARNAGAAANRQELEAAFHPVLRNSGFTEFARFHMGRDPDQSTGRGNGKHCAYRPW